MGLIVVVLVMVGVLGVFNLVFWLYLVISNLRYKLVIVKE